MDTPDRYRNIGVLKLDRYRHLDRIRRHIGYLRSREPISATGGTEIDRYRHLLKYLAAHIGQNRFGRQYRHKTLFFIKKNAVEAFNHAFNLRNLMRARIHPICCINLRYHRVSRYIRFHTFSNGPQFTILSCSKPTHNGFSLVATLASDGSKGVLTARICFFL